MNQNGDVINITDLPPELLRRIFTYLEEDSLWIISRVCRRFRAFVSDDSLWEGLCNRYGISKPLFYNEQEQFTFQESLKLIHPLEHFFCLWALLGDPYGDLFKLTYIEKENGPCLIRYLPARSFRREPGLSVSLPLRQILIKFSSIKMLKDCFIGDPQLCHGIMCSILPKERREINGQWPKLYKMYSLSLSHGHEVGPIRSGLYKGTYGPHGVELLSLYYCSCFETDHNSFVQPSAICNACHAEEKFRPYIVAKKISGDPNVPAGSWSVAADMRKPIVCSEIEQLNWDDMELLSSCSDNMSVQPFVLPHDALADFDVHSLPTTCLSRYCGFGRIAEHGFNRPQTITGHFVIFDTETFGFVWFFLRTFSLYRRISETELNYAAGL